MIKKIPSTHLTKGMFVCGNDRRWLDTPFMRSKFLIKTDRQIKQFQEYCRFAYIDTSKGLDVITPTVPEAPKQPIATHPADELYGNAIDALDDPALRRAVIANDYSGIDPIIHALKLGFEQHGRRLLALTLANTHQTSNAMPINVCVQTLAMADHVNLDSKQRRLLTQLGMACGIESPSPLPDISIEALTTELITQQQRFRLAQLSRIAATNRKRPDECQAQEAWISLLYGFNDVNQALSLHPQPPVSILQRLSEEVPNVFHADLLASFAETLRLYPPGFIVELASGELARIVAVNPDTLDIQALTTPQKQIALQRTIDTINPHSTLITRVVPLDDPLLSVLAVDHCG